MAEEIHYLSFDPEKIFEEMHRAYLEAGGEALYPGDEKDMLLRSCQAVITQAFAGVDHALRMATLRYATGEYLDLYGENRGCLRMEALAAEAEIAIEPVVGPEFVTGSTRMKSGTAQKMVLNMITTSTMIKLGRVKGNRMVNMQLTNQKLVDRGTRMIMEELRLDYEQSKNLLLLHGSVREAIDSYHREWRLNQ